MVYERWGSHLLWRYYRLNDSRTSIHSWYLQLNNKCRMAYWSFWSFKFTGCSLFIDGIWCFFFGKNRPFGHITKIKSKINGNVMESHYGKFNPSPSLLKSPNATLRVASPLLLLILIKEFTNIVLHFRNS